MMLTCISRSKASSTRVWYVTTFIEYSILNPSLIPHCIEIINPKVPLPNINKNFADKDPINRRASTNVPPSTARTPCPSTAKSAAKTSPSTTSSASSKTSPPPNPPNLSLLPSMLSDPPTSSSLSPAKPP